MSMIKIFQHGKDEPAGEIEIFLQECHVQCSVIRLFETPTVPSSLPQGLIILGGQMSVNDTQDYPFFLDEMVLIRGMVAAGRPVLGICLGAQMIASAFGERVYQSTRERGWVPVQGCRIDSNSLFPDAYHVFHWHNETFTLPEGSELLARGSVIANQAFRLGSAIGVQYHPEVTGTIIAQWTRACGAGERKEIIRESEQYSAMNREHCRTLIKHFLLGVDR